MQVKRLGSSELLLSEIGLGTWKYKGGVEPLQAGIDHGVNFIDTAEIYGSEETVGKAVRGRRDRVILATKVAPRNFRPPLLIAAAENSLRRLGTDYIDLYQLHWPNYMVPIGEVMAAIEGLVDAGKVRFIGVSNFSVRELKKAQAASPKYRIVSNQVQYSLIERTIEVDLLKYCQQNAITVIAYSPLGMSFERMRAADPEGALSQAAKAVGKTEAQVALNWLIAKDSVLAIPRTSSVAHAIENCGAAGWRLSESDAALLEAKIRCRRRGRGLSSLARGKRYIAQLLGRSL